MPNGMEMNRSVRDETKPGAGCFGGEPLCRMDIAMTPHGAAPPFMFDRAAETMPRRDLAALQLARLRQTLARAYECVAPIRRKFDAAGATPAHVSCLADLAHFPFTLKADLRDNYPFGLFAVPRDQVIRLHASSGTTQEFRACRVIV